MKIIDLENHFHTPFAVDIMSKRTEFPRIHPEKGLGLADGLWISVTDSEVNAMQFDVGKGRIELMDKCGIDFAQLSFSAPGAEPYDAETSKMIAKDANDHIVAAIAKYPDRLGAYMTLAPKDPEWSVREIDRCLEMGLWGWHTHSNFKDAYPDEKRFWPILKKCEEVDMPIYLHPTVSPVKEFCEFGACLATPSYGYTADTIFSFMRLIHRGVFDEFPKLKIILGHFGEALPFLLDRVNAAYRQGYGMPLSEIGSGYKHEPGYYIKNNLWTTSSGNYLPEALYCTRDALGMDRVTMGTDHPYEKINLGVELMVEKAQLTETEKRAFLFENAKALGFAKHIHA